MKKSSFEMYHTKLIYIVCLVFKFLLAFDTSFNKCFYLVHLHKTGTIFSVFAKNDVIKIVLSQCFGHGCEEKMPTRNKLHLNIYLCNYYKEIS